MYLIVIYATFPNPASAKETARRLLSEELIACANILPEITSIYNWEGKTEESTETAVLFKTAAPLAETAIERIRSLHTYTCPCVIAWPSEQGNPAFFDWVQTEPRKP